MKAVRRAYLGLGFSLGFFSLAGQSLLFREHLLAYHGNELGTGVFLASWLLWIAVGALFGRGISVFRKPVSMAVLCVLFPILFLGQFLLFWNLRAFEGLFFYQFFSLTRLIPWTVVATAPVSFATGLLFTTSVAAYSRDCDVPAAKSTIRFYGSEALGSALGGAAVSMFLWLQVPLLVLISGNVGLWVIGTTGYLRHRRGPKAALAAVVVSVVFAGAGVAVFSAWFQQNRLNSLPLSPQLYLDELVDTPYGSLAVGKIGHQSFFLQDGNLLAVMPDPGATEEVALLMAMNPGAKQVAVVGFGGLSLTCELLEAGAESVVHIGPDELLAGLMITHSPPELAECLRNPGVSIVVDDPTNYFSKLNEEIRFDIVSLWSDDALTAATSRFYRAEFLRLVAAHLSPSGMMTLGVVVSENALLDSDAVVASAVYHQMQRVFSQVAMTSDWQMRFFGGGPEAVVTDDFNVLQKRLEILGKQVPDWNVGTVLTKFETNRITARKATFRRAAKADPLVRSNAPLYLASLVRHERASQAWMQFIRSLRERGLALLWLSFVVMMVAAICTGKRCRRAVPGLLSPILLATVAGAVAMISQTTLLVAFQERFGTLFADFGLLNAGFMLGLFVGGRIEPGSSSGKRLAQAGGPLMATGILVIVLAIPVESGRDLIHLVFRLLPCVLGAGTGAALRVSALEFEERGHSPHAVAALFMASENTGAASGAILASLVLIPVFGVLMAAMVAAAVASLVLGLRIQAALGRRVVVPGDTSIPVGGVRWALVCLVLFAGAGSLLPISVGDGRGDPIQQPGLISGVPAGFVAGVQAGPDGAALDSGDICPSVNGYGGPLGVDVRLDEQERIIAVSLASHRETPAYLYGVAEWLGGAVGKSAPDLEYGTASGNSVDAFSGATVTGEAIVRAIRCAGGHIREQRTGVAMPGDDEIGRSSGHTNAVAGGLLPLLGSAFLLILGLSVCLYGGWRIRVVFLVVLAAVVGGISNHQLALDSVLGIIAGPRPPLSNLGVWLPFAALIAGGFLCGGVFCGNLCPAGAVFELISLVGLRWRPPGSWERRLRQVKYLLALALLAAFLVTGLRDLLAGDPLLTMFRWQGGRRGWILVGLILASNLLWFRAWCRYLCPLGALASLMEMFGGVVRLAPQRRFAACHIGVANSTDLDCLRCNRCVREPRVRTKVKTSAFATALLLLILTAIVVAGVARVSIVNADNSSLVTTTAPSNVQDRQIPVSSSEEDDFQISGTSDMSADGPHIPKAKSEGPRLYRRDNNAYHYQRTIDLRTLRDWFRTGRLSKREAMHYLRVPVQP